MTVNWPTSAFRGPRSAAFLANQPASALLFPDLELEDVRIFAAVVGPGVHRPFLPVAPLAHDRGGVRQAGNAAARLRRVDLMVTQQPHFADHQHEPDGIGSAIKAVEL